MVRRMFAIVLDYHKNNLKLLTLEASEFSYHPPTKTMNHTPKSIPSIVAISTEHSEKQWWEDNLLDITMIAFRFLSACTCNDIWHDDNARFYNTWFKSWMQSLAKRGIDQLEKQVDACNIVNRIWFAVQSQEYIHWYKITSKDTFGASREESWFMTMDKHIASVIVPNDISITTVRMAMYGNRDILHDGENDAVFETSFQ